MEKQQKVNFPLTTDQFLRSFEKTLTTQTTPMEQKTS
jgi:hypothetical protein